MPRERQFSADEVLAAVADVFAVNGFHGTSLAQLTEATGLGKQSLYNSFGDKRALYLQAVDCAAARYGAVAGGMQRATDGGAALRHFFATLLADCGSDDEARRQCVVSAGLLEGVDDEGIRQHLRGKWAATHELLRAAVERGQKDGSIPNPAPSAELADHLMGLMSGLRVAAQAGLPPARLQRNVALGLQLLERRD
jgi:TetR/AcrR family transcriptional regulator, transcriptional repressor for nem operon